MDKVTHSVAAKRLGEREKRRERVRKMRRHTQG